jgi:hypothetical protein
MSDDGLNDNHKRRLAVAMQRVDAAAGRMLDLLEKRTVSTDMTVINDNFDEDERKRLVEALNELRSRAKSFADEYDLDKHRRDVRRTLTAEISEVWTTLENIRPQRMRGMGVLSGEAAEGLTRRVEALLRVVNMIQQAATRNSE